LFNPKGEIIMANIGTFTAEKDGFTGTLRTLTLNVKVKLVPNDKGDNESAPDFRLQAAGHDIGAAWKKTSEAGRPYLSVSLDDPSFPATVYARLIERRGRHARPDLVAQQAQGGLTAAHRAPPIAAGRGAADRSTARTGFRLVAHARHVQGRHRIGDGRMARSPWQQEQAWRVGAGSAAGLSGCAPCRQAVTAIRLQSLTPSRLAALRASLAGIRHYALDALRRSRLFQHGLKLLAHPRQQFVGLVRARRRRRPASTASADALP
jgi:uncharacterized protein (DUF736 family)